MNWKTWAPLVIAVLLGLIAAKIGLDIVGRNRAVQVMTGGNNRIVVVNNDVEPGAALKPTDVGTMEVVTANLPHNAFTEPSQVVGRIAAMNLVKGQPVLESSLAPDGAGSGLQALVPEGKRAVTLEVNEYTGVAGLLVPGSRVDVITTLQDPGRNAPVTRTIVENAPVRAIGPKLKETESLVGDAPLAKSVTLIVTPREAEMIELASNNGRTRLVLRNYADGSEVRSSGVTVAQLIGPDKTARTAVADQAGGDKGGFLRSLASAVFAGPAARPAPTVSAEPREPAVQLTQKRSVEIIRGGAVSTVQFDVPTFNGTITSSPND